MNRKTFVTHLVCLLTLTLSILYIKQFMDNATRETKKSSIHTPDAYMVHALYLQTNAQGKRDIALYTPLARHYKYQDSSEFSHPQIQVFKNNDFWRITANKAKGLHGAATFLLYDHVKVQQLPSRQTPGTILLTHSLTIFPKQNLVTTKDFVTIEQPGMKATAIGLRGDLNSGTIQLLSKTRSQYDPKKSY